MILLIIVKEGVSKILRGFFRRLGRDIDLECADGGNAIIGELCTVSAGNNHPNDVNCHTAIPKLERQQGT